MKILKIAVVLLSISVVSAHAEQDITGKYRYKIRKGCERSLTVTKKQANDYHLQFDAFCMYEDHGSEGGEDFDVTITNGQARIYREPEDEFDIRSCNALVTFKNNTAKVAGECTTLGAMLLSGFTYKKEPGKKKR